MENMLSKTSNKWCEISLLNDDEITSILPEGVEVTAYL